MGMDLPDPYQCQGGGSMSGTSDSRASIVGEGIPIVTSRSKKALWRVAKSLMMDRCVGVGVGNKSLQGEKDATIIQPDCDSLTGLEWIMGIGQA